MQRALDAFRVGIARVEHMAGLYKAIASLTTPAIDTSDLLRAQIVLSVSALDFYIHEVTLLGMLEVYTGKRPQTPAFENYRISVGAMMSASPQVAPLGWNQKFANDIASCLSSSQTR